MNLRPSGYEPDELPGCSTPRQYRLLSIVKRSNVIYWLGDFSEEPTHDPIPNSTVKLLSADGTAS